MSPDKTGFQNCKPRDLKMCILATPLSCTTPCSSLCKRRNGVGAAGAEHIRCLVLNTPERHCDKLSYLRSPLNLEHVMWLGRDSSCIANPSNVIAFKTRKHIVFLFEFSVSSFHTPVYSLQNERQSVTKAV